jgi:hypothetical protein
LGLLQKALLTKFISSSGALTVVVGYYLNIQAHLPKTHSVFGQVKRVVMLNYSFKK